MKPTPVYEPTEPDNDGCLLALAWPALLVAALTAAWALGTVRL